MTTGLHPPPGASRPSSVPTPGPRTASRLSSRPSSRRTTASPHGRRSPRQRRHLGVYATEGNRFAVERSELAPHRFDAHLPMLSEALVTKRDPGLRPTISPRRRPHSPPLDGGQLPAADWVWGVSPEALHAPSPPPAGEHGAAEYDMSERERVGALPGEYLDPDDLEIAISREPRTARSASAAGALQLSSSLGSSVGGVGLGGRSGSLGGAEDAPAPGRPGSASSAEHTPRQPHATLRPAAARAAHAQRKQRPSGSSTQARALTVGEAILVARMLHETTSFATCSEEMLRAVAKASSVRVLGKYRVLYHEGNPLSSCVYLVLRGALRVEMADFQMTKKEARERAAQQGLAEAAAHDEMMLAALTEQRLGKPGGGGGSDSGSVSGSVSSSRAGSRASSAALRRPALSSATPRRASATGRVGSAGSGGGGGSPERLARRGSRGALGRGRSFSGSGGTANGLRRAADGSAPPQAAAIAALDRAVSALHDRLGADSALEAPPGGGGDGGGGAADGRRRTLAASVPDAMRMLTRELAPLPRARGSRHHHRGPPHSAPHGHIAAPRRTPGNLVGEEAALGYPRLATVLAAEDGADGGCEVVAIPTSAIPPPALRTIRLRVNTYLLQTTWLLRTLSTWRLAMLAEHMQLVRVAPNETVCERGQAVERFSLLIRGHLIGHGHLAPLDWPGADVVAAAAEAEVQPQQQHTARARSGSGAYSLGGGSAGGGGGGSVGSTTGSVDQQLSGMSEHGSFSSTLTGGGSFGAGARGGARQRPSLSLSPGPNLMAVVQAARAAAAAASASPSQSLAPQPTPPLAQPLLLPAAMVATLPGGGGGGGGGGLQRPRSLADAAGPQPTPPLPPGHPHALPPALVPPPAEGRAAAAAAAAAGLSPPRSPALSASGGAHATPAAGAAADAAAQLLTPALDSLLKLPDDPGFGQNPLAAGAGPLPPPLISPAVSDAPRHGQWGITTPRTDEPPSEHPTARGVGSAAAAAAAAAASGGGGAGRAGSSTPDGGVSQCSSLSSTMPTMGSAGRGLSPPAAQLAQRRISYVGASPATSSCASAQLSGGARRKSAGSALGGAGGAAPTGARRNTLGRASLSKPPTFAIDADDEPEALEATVGAGEQMAFAGDEAAAVVDSSSPCFTGVRTGAAAGRIPEPPRHAETWRALEHAWLLVLPRRYFELFFTALPEISRRCAEARRLLWHRSRTLLSVKREKQMTQRMSWYSQSQDNAWAKLQRKSREVLHGRDRKGTLAGVSVLAERLQAQQFNSASSAAVTPSATPRLPPSAGRTSFGAVEGSGAGGLLALPHY